MSRILIRIAQLLLIVGALSTAPLWWRWHRAGRARQWAQAVRFDPRGTARLESSIRGAPWWGEGWLALGRTRMMAGEWEQAVRDFQRASRTYWDYNLEAAWGWSLERAGRPREALEHYRRGLEYNPVSDILRERAVAVLLQLSHQRARAPAGDPSARTYRGVEFRPEGLIQAEHLLEEAQEISLDRPELLGQVLEARGMLELIRGHPTRAAELLARRIALAPTEVSVTPLRWTLEEIGALDRERASLRRAMQMGDPPQEIAAGWVRELESRPELLGSGDGEGIYLLGLAHYLAGREEALDALSRVQPDSPYAREALRLQQAFPAGPAFPGIPEARGEERALLYAHR